MGIGCLNQERVEEKKSYCRLRNNTTFAFLGEDALDLTIFFASVIKPFGRVLIMDASYSRKIMNSFAGVIDEKSVITVHGIDYCAEIDYYNKMKNTYDVIIIYNDMTEIAEFEQGSIQHIYCCNKLQYFNRYIFTKEVKKFPNNIAITVICRDAEKIATNVIANNINDLHYYFKNIEKKIYFLPYTEEDANGLLRLGYGACRVKELSKEMQEVLHCMYNKLRYLSGLLAIGG